MKILVSCRQAILGQAGGTVRFALLSFPCLAKIIFSKALMHLRHSFLGFVNSAQMAFDSVDPFADHSQGGTKSKS